MHGSPTARLQEEEHKQEKKKKKKKKKKRWRPGQSYLSLFGESAHPSQPSPLRRLDPGESRNSLSPLPPSLRACERCIGILPASVMSCQADGNVGEAGTPLPRTDKKGRKRRLRLQQWTAPCPPNPRLQRTHRASVCSRRSHSVRPAAGEKACTLCISNFFLKVFPARPARLFLFCYATPGWTVGRCLAWQEGAAKGRRRLGSDLWPLVVPALARFFSPSI